MARKKNQVFRNFTTFVILPLMVIDAYAYWRVHKSSEHWLTGALSFSEPLSQLAIILGINIAVIMILMAYIGNRG
jgi:hypothetical protein